MALSDQANAEARSSRKLMAALALATVLPFVALLWRGAIAREVVVLALIAWIGLFATALGSARAQDRRRRSAEMTRHVRRPQVRG